METEFSFVELLKASPKEEQESRALAVTHWLIGAFPVLIGKPGVNQDDLRRELNRCCDAIGAYRNPNNSAPFGVRADVLGDMARRLVKMGFNNQTYVDKRICEFSGLCEPEERNPFGL